MAPDDAGKHLAKFARCHVESLPSVVMFDGHALKPEVGIFPQAGSAFYSSVNNDASNEVGDIVLRPRKETIAMATGTVKWFDSKKGFGFIINAEGKDVFVHFSTIEGDGFRALKDGETVEYEQSQGDKGLLATQVRRTAVLQLVK